MQPSPARLVQWRPLPPAEPVSPARWIDVPRPERDRLQDVRPQPFLLRHALRLPLLSVVQSQAVAPHRLLLGAVPVAQPEPLLQPHDLRQLAVLWRGERLPAVSLKSAARLPRPEPRLSQQ